MIFGFNNMEVSNNLDKNRFNGIMEEKYDKMGLRENGKKIIGYKELIVIIIG